MINDLKLIAVLGTGINSHTFGINVMYNESGYAKSYKC